MSYSQKSRLHVFARGFRAAFVMLLVAAGCYVAYGFGQLWAEWREARQPAPMRKSPAVELDPRAGMLPLAGQWSFADLDWNLRSSVINRDEVDGRFQSSLNTNATDNSQELPDVSQELLDLADTFHIRPVERDGYQFYHLNRPDLKAQLVVRKVEGRAKVVALAAAYPQDGQQWQMFELTPRGSSPNRKSAAVHLLPLPPGAVRRGGRFADDGRLLLELIALESNADSLISMWKEAGWEVRPSGLGDPNAFSFLCAHGDDVIYAWSANPRESLHNLMLVRSPSNEEIQTLPKSNDAFGVSE